jgi:hypothetical protein
MWPRGQQVHLVMPAQAGIQSTQHRIFWVPAFAGMTVSPTVYSPTAQLCNYANSDCSCKI